MKVIYATDLREFTDKNLMCLSEKDGNKMSKSISYNDFIQSLTPAKKKFALSVVEIYNRDKMDCRKINKINGPSDIYSLMYEVFAGLKVEEFWVIFLNRANKPIKAVRFSVGGLDQAVADQRLVLKEALLCNASAIAIIHNHPSGSKEPSKGDDVVTNTFTDCCKMFDIKLIDHLIFTEDGFYSYSWEGRL